LASVARFAEESFLGMSASLKAVNGRRSCPLRRDCLSVSTLGYPSVGCSPAEPLAFHRASNSCMLLTRAEVAFFEGVAGAVAQAFWKPRLLGL
jgi:hypothetical protein